MTLAPPHDEAVPFPDALLPRLEAMVAERRMRLWRDPGNRALGAVFCPVCGWGGAWPTVLARYLTHPWSCARGCNGRAGA